ncbi:hypothetical protein [uncultured Tateyamaria sp.]|uniref:hypothetical protein n=1 Tax=uncultured Tateyamaria sp. TaxID=455651 RepID=UPI002621DEA5|nr:hypothetical protein [uncultured Tateyamaria sp.]
MDKDSSLRLLEIARPCCIDVVRDYAASMEDARINRIGPTSAARYAADLETFLPRQGESIFSRVPFEIEASFGEQEFTDNDGFGFKLSFRRAFVEVIPENCEISRDGRYQRSLPRDQFHHLLKRVSESSSSKKGIASGGVSLQFSKILSALGIETSLHGEMQKKIQTGDMQSTESQLEFKIVRWVGASRWQIGHEVIGDPNEPSGELRGGYFSQLGDDAEDGSSNPLCFLIPKKGSKFSASVELRARKRDCVYSPLGDERNEESWAKKNKTQIERLLTLRMLEEQNRADGLSPPEGEVVLARGHIEVSKSRKSK